jgi:hypothetical protein
MSAAARNVGGEASDAERMSLTHIYLVAREDNAGARFEAPTFYWSADAAFDRVDELVALAKGEKYFVLAIGASCLFASTGNGLVDMQLLRKRIDAVTGKR